MPNHTKMKSLLFAALAFALASVSWAQTGGPVCVDEEQALTTCAETNDFDYEICMTEADAYNKCVALSSADSLDIQNCFGIYNIWRACRDAKDCTDECDNSDLPITCDRFSKFNYCDWDCCCDACKAWIGEDEDEPKNLRLCLTVSAGCVDLLVCDPCEGETTDDDGKGDDDAAFSFCQFRKLMTASAGAGALGAFMV